MAITPNINKYQNPIYDFPNPLGTALKNAAINELHTSAETALLTTTEFANRVRIKLNAKNNPPEFTTTQSDYYTKNSNRAYLNVPMGVASPDATGRISTVYNIKFEATKYINDFGESDTTPELEIPICTLDVTNSKTVIKTPLINQTGTVKEIPYNNDVTININGILIGYFTKPTAQNPLAGKPMEDMAALINIFEANVPIKVTSDYLNSFGVTKIVIENLHLPQDLDMKNIQSFTIQAVSDSDDISII